MNRLSLGLQSLDDRLLRVLGRNHDAAAGPAAVRLARAVGIDNLSVDLMFGLPGQSFDDWRRAVDQVRGARPPHVSAYALTIERGTPFGARARKGERMAADDELAARMQEWVRDALAAAGLAQYEVSSYARPGMRAVHNRLYWSGAPYLGVGASAASFRPLSDGTGWRFSNPRATDTYLRAAAQGGEAGTWSAWAGITAASAVRKADPGRSGERGGLARLAHQRRHRSRRPRAPLRLGSGSHPAIRDRPLRGAFVATGRSQFRTPHARRPAVRRRDRHAPVALSGLPAACHGGTR